MKILCAWSSLVLEKGLPMMHLAILTMPFCVDPVCVDHWLPQRSSLIPPGSSVDPLRGHHLRSNCQSSQDQQYWSSQRQLPQRQSSIPPGSTRSSQRQLSIPPGSSVDPLRGDHWSPRINSVDLSGDRRSTPLQIFHSLIFNIRITS